MQKMCVWTEGVKNFEKKKLVNASIDTSLGKHLKSEFKPKKKKKNLLQTNKKIQSIKGKFRYEM